MPFIVSRVSVPITKEQETELKAWMGRAIELVPGKSEEYLLLENRQFKGRYPGLDKNGVYGYPTALVWSGTLYVTCSINKEMIAVMHVYLDEI